MSEVTAADSSLLIDSVERKEDVIGEGVIVDLPTLTHGISTVKVILRNQDGENNDIAAMDDVVVQVGRSSLSTIFSGKVMRAIPIGDLNKNIYNLELHCEGKGWKLNRPANRLFAKYVQADAREILQAAVALTDLNDTHVDRKTTRALTSTATSGQRNFQVSGSGWFFIGEIIKIWDDNAYEWNEIADDLGGGTYRCTNNLDNTYTVAANGQVSSGYADSKHDMEFNGIDAGYVMRSLLPVMKDGSNIGFTGYVDSDGYVYVFRRGLAAYTSAVTAAELNDIMRRYKAPIDAHRIINKQTVYGAAKKINPSNDSWCESLTPTEGTWSAGEFVTLATDNVDKIMGSYSIHGTHTAITGYSHIRFTLAQAYRLNLKKAYEYQTLGFSVKLSNEFSGLILIELADAEAPIQPATMQRQVLTGSWQKIEVGIGYENRHLWRYGNDINWANIFRIDLCFRNTGFPDWIGDNQLQGEFRLDDLHVGGARFRYTAEDSASQSTYGTITGKHKIMNHLGSDAECQIKAEQLVDKYKNPLRTIEEITIEGRDGNFTQPALKQHVQLSNENIDDYFEIANIRHIIKGTHWHQILTFEPY